MLIIYIRRYPDGPGHGWRSQATHTSHAGIELFSLARTPGDGLVGIYDNRGEWIIEGIG